MRVLQVVTQMNRGGLETMLMNYYRHIDREQVQFDFLVHRECRASYDDEIELLGGKIYRLPKLNPWGKQYKKALRNFLKCNNYSVVHVHLDCMSAIVLKEVKKNNAIGRIAHSHNNNIDKDIKYPIKLLYKREIPKYATHLLACSNEAGRFMFADAPFQVLNNAIDTQLYKYDELKRRFVRTQFGISDDTLVVGHVGRISPQKNHSFLIDIFASIRRSTKAKLLLVGDGKLRQKIEKKVNSLNLKDDVIFTGVRTDVANLMQAMDVFILPSHYEGLGMVVIEAQAAGLPCLVSNKVSLECIKTDLVNQMRLDETPEQWASKAIDIAHTKRRILNESLKDFGYDILENSKLLQNFYLQVAEGNKKACLR